MAGGHPLPFILLLSLVFLLSSSISTAKKIALVYDDRYVSTHEDVNRNNWGEARNVRAFLEFLNYHPYLITDYDNVVGWTTTLANARTVIFPIPRDSADLVADAPPAEPIRAWVSSGGVAVFCFGTQGLARQLTGLSLGGLLKKRGGSGGPWNKTSSAWSLFPNGPAQLEDYDAAYSWYLDGDLPGEAADLKCMYGTTNHCAVWVYKQGSGRWIGVAPDFWDFGYTGGQDGGWVSVMTTIAAYPSSASQLTSWATWVTATLLRIVGKY